MTDQFFPESQLPIRKTVDLLPGVFKTETNSKFMAAAVDPLVQPGLLQKTVGYVGRRYGKTYSGLDTYLDSDNTLRSRYQLEPGVVFTDGDKVENFYDYIDFKNQLKFFGNTIERDDLITAQEHYSWNPPISWDKFINYREYFWEPDGPLSVPVSGHSAKVISEYTVKASINISVKEVPNSFSLGDAFPNPSSNDVTIAFDLKSNNNVSIKLVNLVGQEVMNIANDKFSAGANEVKFNVSNLTAGVYFYTMTVDGVSQSQKIMIK